MNLPDWFKTKMNTEFGPNWGEGDVMKVLLGDYLKRNAPKEVVYPKFEQKATIKVVCKHTDHLMDKNRLKVGRSYLVLDISKCKQYYRMKDDYGNLSYFSVERFR